MDSPTSFFFFNLERKSVQVNQMYNLKNDNGQCTSEPVEMRRLAVNFYSHLYSPEDIDIPTQNGFLQDLPCLNEEDKQALESGLTFAELNDPVRSFVGSYPRHRWTSW